MMITAAIPARNAAMTLARTLVSLLNEERRPDEILVVDDASTDATQAIAISFQRAGAPLRIVATPSPHSGATQARRVAVCEAKGDWVAFMDADDEAEPFRLSRYIAALEKHPDAIGISSPPRYIHPDGPEDAPAYPTEAPDIAALEPVYNVFHIPVSMLRRDAAVASLEGMNETVIEDWAMALALSRIGQLVNLIDPASRVHVIAGSRSGRLGYEQVRVVRRAMLAAWFPCTEAEVADRVRERATAWLKSHLAEERELIIWGGGEGGNHIENLLTVFAKSPGSGSPGSGSPGLKRTGQPLPNHPRAVSVEDAITSARQRTSQIFIASRASREIVALCEEHGLKKDVHFQDVSPVAWGVAWDQNSTLYSGHRHFIRP
jgi:hypothetical protein